MLSPTWSPFPTAQYLYNPYSGAATAAADPIQELGEQLADLSLLERRLIKRPPATYLCHLCFQKGHYIKDCPQVSAKVNIIFFLIFYARETFPFWNNRLLCSVGKFCFALSTRAFCFFWQSLFSVRKKSNISVLLCSKVFCQPLRSVCSFAIVVCFFIVYKKILKKLTISQKLVFLSTIGIVKFYKINTTCKNIRNLQFSWIAKLFKKYRISQKPGKKNLWKLFKMSKFI